MSTAIAEGFQPRNVVGEWLSFVVQAFIAVSVEVGDDLGRGAFAQHGTAQGIHDAHQVVAFEAAHGFWIEPAWQLFFEQTRHILNLTITWPDTVRAMNGIYVLAHVFVTLAVALWVYFHHRPAFRFLRNTFILINGLALVVYENFPVAPPRLTTNLVFDHHAFTFQDTVYGILSSGGKIVGTQLGYNEFSAMPSVHMAWALMVGAVIVVLARPLVLRIAGAIYPAIMLVAVVVTGNHYLLDVVGAAIVTIVAACVAAAFEYWVASKPRHMGAVVIRPYLQKARAK